MTAVRQYYCKYERNAPCGKDNVGTREQKRQPAIATLNKSIIKSGSGKESGKIRNTGKMPVNDRSADVQVTDPVLSPETSTALENAEKIIDNAKIRLMEICGTSKPESARWNVDAYLNDPPLDDETEELLYIRELVASKFHETNSSRCEDASGKVNSGELPRVAVRRVDLSAPKFQMSQRRRRRRRRRCDDWSSLEYDDTDDRGSQERAPLTEMPAKDLLRDEGEALTCDHGQASSPSSMVAAAAEAGAEAGAAEHELVRMRGNACRIQIGPSLHITNRELTRQDLDDVHISPEPFRTQSRTNTAIYALRHDVAGSSTFADNEAEMAWTSRNVLRARLDPLQRERRAAESENSASGPNLADGWNESPQTRERKSTGDGEKYDLQDTEETRTHERSEPIMNQTSNAVNYAPTADARSANEKSKRKNQAEVTVRDDTSCYVDNGAGLTSGKRGDIDGQVARHSPDKGSAADEIRLKKQSDRSKPPFPRRGDAPRGTGFRRRAAESMIDESDEQLTGFSNSTRDNQSEPTDEPYDTISENVPHRFFINRYHPSAFLRAENDPIEIDLYQPHLHDLDSILQSNEERLEHVTRAAHNLVQLLLRPEFAKYRLDDDRQTTPRYATNFEKFYCKSSASKELEGEIQLARTESVESSTMEIELKNEDLTVPCASGTSQVDTTLQKAFDHEIKSSIDCKRDDSNNPIEFSVYPVTLEANDGFGSIHDKAREGLRDEAYLSTSTDGSDVTTFSNVLPALSSTHTTETQPCRCPRKEQSAQNDRVEATPANRPSRSRDIDRFRKRGCSDDVLSQVLRGLKDTSGSAVDRFVTYVLQDERQSIERKITNAVKDSAITPVAVQKLLDRLRESIRNVHRTETLDILKNILINIKNEAKIDEAENKRNKKDKEVSFPDLPDSSVRMNRNETLNETKEFISRKESPRQMQAIVDTSKLEQISKRMQNLEHRADNSTNCPANQDTRENVRSEIRSEIIDGSKGNNESKGDPYSEAESLKQISDIGSDNDEHPNRNSLSTKIASVRSDKISEVNDVSDILVGASGKEEDEVKSEKDDARDKNNLADQSINENIMSATETIDPRLDISEVKALIATKEAHDNVAPMSKEGLLESLEISEIKEPAQSDTSSVKSKFLDIISKQENVIFVQSSKENAGSPRTTKDDIESQYPVEKLIEDNSSPAKFCLNDDPRDACASLSSVKNNENSSLKKIASLNTEKEDNSKRDTKDERDAADKPMTITVIANGDFGLSKSARDDNEGQPIGTMSTLEKYKIDILSSSNSSIDTMLDNDRYINSISDAKVKGLGISSETSSHSEGELYMPSSCSYSLGEVRVLKKHDSIMDNTMDRDSSSVAVLVTRSMLTSLNDSTTTSSLGNSERAKLVHEFI